MESHGAPWGPPWAHLKILENFLELTQFFPDGDNCLHEQTTETEGSAPSRKIHNEILHKILVWMSKVDLWQPSV